MANTSISNLAAGAAVSATDVVPNVQVAGVGPVKTTAAQLKTFMSDSPTLVTPTLGVATATSINKVTITAPATSATVTPTNGTTTVLSGGTLREVLTGNRTYYVRTDGSDSNDGLANTAAGAFLTIQKAVNVVAALDISIYNVTIKLGNSGTWTAGCTVSAPWIGSGEVTLQGDTTTPANTVISVTGGNAISVASGARLAVQAFKMSTTTSGNCLNADGGLIRIVGALDFGACANFQISAVNGARVFANFGAGAYTISGGAWAHWFADATATMSIRYTTITLTGTPAFSVQFAQINACSVILVDGITFSGSATGTRYLVQTNAVLNTSGGGANYLPGNAGGSTATGGIYA